MPTTKFTTPEKYTYLTGFGGYHESEALPGTLPEAQSTPQKPSYGLYTERISGSSFVAARSENRHTWLYRIVPSAAHAPFECEPNSLQLPDEKLLFTPTQMRWDPFDVNEKADWVHSMQLIAGAGEPSTRSGVAYHIFSAGQSMEPRSVYYSADGDLLVILQQGVLDIRTELGYLLVRPNEICVIPRGIRYNVALPEGPVRGYSVELHQGSFTLPELGPIGSNGLANARDFQIPKSSFDEDTDNEYQIYVKFNGQLFKALQDHSPFDIVGWHGAYYPYKYDLGRFLTFGSVSYDHPDPSIFTVLSSSEKIVELAAFTPRWLTMEDTFRPPYYHRNTMSEYMGLITGGYDARTKGFLPGGATLHNVMSAHDPDSESHHAATHAELTPQKVGEGSMAFILESPLILGLSQWALETSGKRQLHYNASTWLPLKPRFSSKGAGEMNGHPIEK
ncbi:hypothetical protein M409DRAFT_71414 [Zasmidium cellare ATCC 36951]|uniref:homogentisate 1,2-dioxygenase n=1 Tax=Zasmidium cellare ATCC 36951 TaxID=1080233 RepID=A0A6A6BVL3_ZASCE|nr:uncharacterized protein M409DRAFT_71414 [Zasmidium cellare ATCC 36951]KAF2158854.1 hypothetical protein M409DRAFT_71414 [Zasmidium cellare ATCC 36951]